MKFLIPSYKRPHGVTSIDTLVRFGAKKEDIIVGVQSEEDYEAYAHYGVTLVKNYNAHNAAGNRNGLLRWAHENNVNYAVFLDDDLLDIDLDCDIYVELERDIVRMRKLRAMVVEWSAMKLEPDVQETSLPGFWWVDFFWTAQFVLCDMNAIPMFNEEFDCLDDTEWSYHIYSTGGHTLHKCDMHVSFGAWSDGSGGQSGGCTDAYKIVDKGALLRRLANRYPNTLMLDGDALYEYRGCR